MNQKENIKMFDNNYGDEFLEWSYSQLKNLPDYHKKKGQDYYDYKTYAQIAMNIILAETQSNSLDRKSVWLGKVKDYVLRLEQRKPLIPIDGHDFDWLYKKTPSGKIITYNSHYTYLEKFIINGKEKLIDFLKFKFINVLTNEPYGMDFTDLNNSLFFEILLNDLYPIYFPYYPETNPYIAYYEGFYYDKKLGSNIVNESSTMMDNTIKLICISENDIYGPWRQINRCFKYTPKKESRWTEIKEKSYNKRKAFYKEKFKR